MEDRAWMARANIQFCLPIIAMYRTHIWGCHSETGTIRCPYVGLLPDQWCYACQYGPLTLFSQISCNIENIPPTKAALGQHIKRSSYQSEHGQSPEVQSELPDVTDWGWETSQTAGYIPTWTTLSIAEVACIELISCKCAKYCNWICNCFKAELECMHPTF